MDILKIFSFFLKKSNVLASSSTVTNLLYIHTLGFSVYMHLHPCTHIVGGCMCVCLHMSL